MSAVAETSGSASATVTLFENGVTESLVATSDNTARTANELELVLGEGPTRESAAGGDLVYAGDAELRKRWPQCGPALAALDVRSVAAAPLRTHTSRLGTLTVFDPRPTVRSSDLAQLIETADALTDSVLLASAAAFDDGVPDLPLFNEAEQQVVTHQAAGMLSVQAGCDIADAFTLLCARAFATGERVEDVAHRVVNEGLRLT